MAHEKSPLCLYQASPGATVSLSLSSRSTSLWSSPSSIGDHDDDVFPSSSVASMVLNIAKTCACTGCLALPYAAKQSGMIVYVGGMILMAAWNAYSVQQLCECFEEYERGRSDRGKDPIENYERCKTYHDMCERGKLQVDRDDAPKIQKSNLETSHPSHVRDDSITSSTTMVAFHGLGSIGAWTLYVMMIFLLFNLAVSSHDSIRTLLHNTPITTGMAAYDSYIVTLLLSMLSVFSDMGYLTKTSIIGLTLLTLVFVTLGWYAIETHGSGDPSMGEYRLIPAGTSAVVKWFALSSFGFGVVPLTFSFRDHMAHPKQIALANHAAIASVTTLYLVIGIGLSVWYPHISDDALDILLLRVNGQGAKFLLLLSRLAMIGMIFLSTPLVVVPLVELLESRVACLSSSLDWWVRIWFCVGSGCVSFGLPTVSYVSYCVGSFCMVGLNLAIPPLLHMATFRERGRRVDMFLLVIGVVATVVATVHTFDSE